MKQKATLILTHVTEPVTGTGQKGPWTKHTFIFTSGNDTIAMDAFNFEGDPPPTGGSYDVEFYLESREYNGKYYTNCKLANITHPERPPTPVDTHPQPRQTSMDMGNPRQAVERSRQRTEQLAATQENDLPF